jgi:ribosomal protein S12 methylthiotransferase
MNKIGLISLGCAKNLVNSEQMLFLLREAGYEITGDCDCADAVVVNTCGFIESAKMEAIDTILELAQAKKEGKIIVAGCLSERYKEDMLKELPEIDALVGVGSYQDIVSAVETALEGLPYSKFGDKNIPDPEVKRVITTSNIWAFLKIAEGCDNRCAYCVIPDIRGKFRSRPMANILSEAEDLVARGIKELIIVAQDTTRYGLDLCGKRQLPELLEALCRIEDLQWIRLHYLYPDEIDDALIDVIAKNDKILKYLDIPIQHINDGILKKMCRRGTGADIRTLLKKLREKIPGVVLRTSLITGLPGENTKEFEELYAFLKEAQIERAGVFPYSPEEGTPAASMAYPDHETACTRAETIMALQSDIMETFTNNRIGSVIPVLCEGVDGEYFYGRSYAESPEIDGFIYFNGEGVKVHDFNIVKIIDTLDGEPLGVLVEE